VAIDSCPECDAPLHARREVWFTGVSLGGDGSIVSATPRGDMDEVWRVYCTRGHEIAPTLIVGSRRRVPEPPDASQRVVTLGTAVNEGQLAPSLTQPVTTGPDSPRLAAVPSPQAVVPLKTEPEVPVIPEPVAQTPIAPPMTEQSAGTEVMAPVAAAAMAQAANDAPADTDRSEDMLPYEQPAEAQEPQPEVQEESRQSGERKHRVSRTPRSSSQRTALIFGWVLFAIGAVAIAAALVYFTVTAGHLPTFMGRIDGSTLYRRKPGVVIGAAGVLLWIASVFAFTRARVSPGPDDLIVGFE
jgi:hypothetical protein